MGVEVIVRDAERVPNNDQADVYQGLSVEVMTREPVGKEATGWPARTEKKAGDCDAIHLGVVNEIFLAREENVALLLVDASGLVCLTRQLVCLELHGWIEDVPNAFAVDDKDVDASRISRAVRAL